MGKVYIYGLVEHDAPIKGVRYIGITNNLDNRLMSHLDSSESTDKALWVNGVKGNGDTVDMVILDSADTRKDALVKEAAWIRFAEDRDWDLTNTSRPASSSLALVADIKIDEESWRATMVNALFAGRSEALHYAYDIKSQIEGLRFEMSNPQDAAQDTEPIAIKAPSITDVKPNRNPLMGGLRCCLVGGIACLAMYAFGFMEFVMGIDFSFALHAMIFVAFIASIYPCFLLVKLALAWALGYDNPLALIVTTRATN